MSKYDGKETLIDKIKARRTYADHQGLSSGSSDSSRDGTHTETSVPPLTGISVKSYIKRFSASNMEPENTTNVNNFRSMVADPSSDSEEENDKMPTYINVFTINGATNTDRPLTDILAESKDQNCDMTNTSITNTLPCDILFVDNDGIIKRFNNFDEISEYLVNASVNGRDSRISTLKLGKLTKVPLRIVDHYITIGMYLKRLYEHDFLMDVVIDVRGEKFYAHRIALCCYSEYFADLFQTSKGKKIPFDVRINGVCPKAFAAFLEFCYTGELKVNPGIAGDILIITDFLKVRALKARCDLIIKNLPLSHAVKVISKTSVKSNQKLHQCLCNTMLENFSEASKIDNFLDLDIETFCKMIQSDDLVVTSEYELFTIVVRWIVHDMPQRVKHTVRVMSHVRFSEMTQSELFLCAETTSLVRGYDKFREMILIANWIITTTNAGKVDSFSFPRSNPRKCFMQTKQCNEQLQDTTNPSMEIAPPIMTSTPTSEKSSSLADLQKCTNFVDILVIGGFTADQKEFTSTNVDKYDVEDNQWLHFCGLPKQRRHHAVVSMDNVIYMIGGCDPSDKSIVPIPTNGVYRMHLKTKEWTEVSMMNNERHSHSACVVDGIIYVIGGKGTHNSVLDAVECYDPTENIWQLVPSLPEPLYGSAVASLQSRILVAGGISSSDEIPSALHVLSSVYCFNTSTSSWTRLRDLRFPRCHASLVNVNDRLFLCGGATRSHCVKNSVLCSTSNMDEYNQDNDTWKHVTDMVIPRHNAAVAVAGSRIYVIGGISTPADQILQSIECYETISDAWLPGVQDLPYPARWICCCSVHSRYRRPVPKLIF